MARKYLTLYLYTISEAATLFPETIETSEWPETTPYIRTTEMPDWSPNVDGIIYYSKDDTQVEETRIWEVATDCPRIRIVSTHFDISKNTEKVRDI